MLPMVKSVTFTGACAIEIIPSINRSLVYKAKKGRHVRIQYKHKKISRTNTQVRTDDHFFFQKDTTESIKP